MYIYVYMYTYIYVCMYVYLCIYKYLYIFFSSCFTHYAHVKSVASLFRLFAREDRHNVVHIAGLHDVKVESIGSVLEVCIL